MKRFLCFLTIIAVCLCLPPLSTVHADDKIQITDMVGRQVVFNKTAERIVTTFKPAALCVLSLGLSGNLVGIDTHSQRDRLQLAVCPQIEQLPTVGTKTSGLNLETIINLRPDLVLLYAQKDGIRIADRLRAHGIGALIVVPETFDGLDTTLRIIATAVGKPQQAETIIQASKRLRDRVARTVAPIPVDQRQVVYYGSGKGVFSTTTGNMLQDDMIHRAGGINASHELRGYFREISPEQFIQWNPALVVVARSAGAQASQLASRKQFRSVRAVADGRIYLFPADLAPWDFPSPLSTIGVLWLAKRLYPDRFEDLDLMTEIDHFHEILFGKRFSAMGGHLADRLP